MTKQQIRKHYEKMLVAHTGKELQKAPLVKTAWLVDSMIPSTGVTFLHGPTTAGKSALTWAIGNAVQTGKPLLGCLNTVKTEVLFVSLDMAEDPIKMRWFGTKDKPKAPSSRFNPEFTTIFPKLFPLIEENPDGDAFRAAFKSFIKPYGLIVIDALGRFVGDTISGTDATLCYKYLSQVVGEKACILIHHDAKNKGKSKADDSNGASDAYSGTKRWIDFAQHQLHLSQTSKENLRILTQGKSQLAPDLDQPWKLMIDVDGKICLYDEARLAHDKLNKARLKIPGFNKLSRRQKDLALAEKLDITDRQVRKLRQKAEKTQPQLHVVSR